MRLLEYQAKEILSAHGISIPLDVKISRISELAQAVRKVGGYPAVLKAQVYAGGRGKAGGVVKVKNLAAAKQVARRLLGKRLVTAQTGPEGVPVKALLVEQSIHILKEFYVSILMDRSRSLPVMVASRQGGIAIEELAREKPEEIRRTPFDPFWGLMLFQARSVVGWLGIPKEHQDFAVAQLMRLAEIFFDLDASLLEVNPWALTKERGMLAVDAKLTVDDNGLYRQPLLAEWKAADADSPAEARSRRIGISYVGLGGSIGCMVNGAGLAMATMDLIKLHGGNPANFLDVGGGADVHQVGEAFRLILSDPKVKAVLVNIFGGIMKCDLIAQGILSAAKSVKIKVPLVVRLEGTNVELGRKMLEASGLGFITAADMDTAARKVVEAAR